MIIRSTSFIGAFAALLLPLSAQEPKVDDSADVPKDLIDQVHVREELGVNEFTAPSIAKLFDTLQFLMPLPIAEVQRKMPSRMSQDRADLAIELGFLIAEVGRRVQASRFGEFVSLIKHTYISSMCARVPVGFQWASEGISVLVILRNCG